MTPKHNINIPVERHQNDSKVCYQSIGCQYINRSVKLVINGPVLKLYILRTVDFRILGPKTRTDNIDIFIYANIYICLYLYIRIYEYIRITWNSVTLTPCQPSKVQSHLQ